MTSPRTVTPRQWGTLVLTAAALSHATALPAQAADPATQIAPVVAGGEGGEGGEGGAVVGKTDAQAYLIRLVTVDGHLRAGVEAYRNGFVAEAIALVGHPEAEVMDDLLPQMEARGAGDLDAQIGALSAAMAQGATPDAVEAAYRDAQARIADAMDLGEGGVKGQLEATYELLAAAAAEYEQSLEDGIVTDPVAWQEAHGFFIAAADIAGRLDTGDTPAAATALAAITPARDAFVVADGTPQPVETSLLHATAAQVEFAALAAK